MASYSQSSRSRLMTCHRDLQVIFNTAIHGFDHSILIGHRAESEQNSAYQSGKSQLKWPESKHNKSPSMAVDAAPYPIDWQDRERFTLFGGYVLAIADILYRQGSISHKLRWGGDWDSDTKVSDNNFDDLVHFELVEN